MAPSSPLAPLRALNATVVRIMGTNLLTIRIDLQESQRPTALQETGRNAL